MQRLGQGMAAAKRLDQPAGTLREALRQMWWIERSRTATETVSKQSSWPDRASHLAYLTAVRKVAQTERRAAEATPGSE